MSIHEATFSVCTNYIRHNKLLILLINILARLHFGKNKTLLFQ